MSKWDTIVKEVDKMENEAETLYLIFKTYLLVIATNPMSGLCKRYIKANILKISISFTITLI